MATELEQRFSAPFDVADARAAEVIFLKTAGVHVAEVQVLSDMVHADLSEAVAGIAWWSDHLESQRRVLISDHLVSAVDSIDTNLCEAALHIFAADSAWSEVDRKHARVVQVGGSIRWPIPKSGADLLPEKLEKLHTAGFFRAIGSVLDCLAAAAIAVAAVPQSLLKADFEKFVRWLSRDISPTAKRHPIHDDLRVHMASAIESAGPHGWLQWASDYRNMFVHRGRRTGIVKMDLETSIVDPTGAPIPRAKSTRLLLQDPGRSDVESLVRYRTQELTLTEPAGTTMPALLESTADIAHRDQPSRASGSRERS